MSNRAGQQGMLDANSQQPLSFVASTQIATNVGTQIATESGVFHGILVVSAGSGAWSATVYDSTVSSTMVGGVLVTTTAIGVLNTTTAAGATSFQWGGDIIYNTGLAIVTTQGTPGIIKVLYL